jgi:drug/metabolite transporter (DMT)-like permease
MYHFILGTTFLKSVIPYFRKHVLGTLNSDEFLLLNSTIIFVIVLIIFIIKILTGEQHETFKQIINNYKKMTYSQVICISIIASLTVLSSLFIYELDKHHNTPLINTILLRSFSIISMILVAVFIFDEEYNWMQILGCVLAFIGVFLIMQKPKKTKK